MDRKRKFAPSPVTVSLLKEAETFMTGRGLMPACLHVILLILHSLTGLQSALVLLRNALPGQCLALVVQVDCAFKNLDAGLQ